MVRREFPGGPEVKIFPFNAGVQVPSLIGELRPTCLLAIKQKQHCDKSKKNLLKRSILEKKKKKENGNE